MILTIFSSILGGTGGGMAAHLICYQMQLDYKKNKYTGLTDEQFNIIMGIIIGVIFGAGIGKIISVRSANAMQSISVKPVLRKIFKGVLM